jgi:hypothetical protein
MCSGWIAEARDLRPEPTLAELLADPIVFALMQADRVDPREIAALVSRHVRNLPRSAGAKH